MQPHLRDMIGGRVRVQNFLENQRKVQAGKVVKKQAKNIRQVDKSQVQRFEPKKKSVNMYMLFRTIMTRIFHNLPQAERSPYIRAMWEQERSKESWNLMAKVWTHIRDFSGGFTGIVAYLAAAMDICQVVTPDRWLATYNMLLVRGHDGKVTLRQHHEPTLVPTPRNLTDVELLFGVLKRGLPVKDPLNLLQSITHNSNHVMTVSNHSEKLAAAARVQQSFFTSIDLDPIDAFSETAGVPLHDDAFDFGVNVIDIDDIENVDASLLMRTNDYTHYPQIEYDEITAHFSLPTNDSLDLTSIMDVNQIFNMEMASEWEEFSGQLSQRDFENDSTITHNAAPDCPFNRDFEGASPSWDLQ